MELRPSYASYISLGMAPCDISHDGDKCITDKQKQKTYLDPLNYKYYNTFLYYNYETFDADSYGE